MCCVVFALQQCMRTAVDNNMNIVVHIHLDDGLDKGTWRNVMIFNPIQKYGGVTYWDTVVKPTADAVKMANYKGKEVYFAMQVNPHVMQHSALLQKPAS